MSAFDAIAPYPKTVEDVTAEGMARHHAAFVQLHYRLMLDPDTDTVEAKGSMALAVAYYGITYLLRELNERAGAKQADEVAKELWSDWESGGALGPQIWEWLAEDGIDPERVNGIADEEKARRAIAKLAGNASSKPNPVEVPRG